MSKIESIYRIIFIQNETQYEIYAQYISEDHLMGFIEVEGLIFTEAKSSVVIDPNEEKLRTEFKGVKRCYIPMHSILRIDEVIKEGAASIKEVKKGNVSRFPRTYTPPTDDEK